MRDGREDKRLEIEKDNLFKQLASVLRIICTAKKKVVIAS